MGMRCECGTCASCEINRLNDKRRELEETVEKQRKALKEATRLITELKRERDEARAKIEAALACVQSQGGVIKADPDQIIRGMVKALTGRE